jgi:hypothetical protein
LFTGFSSDFRAESAFDPKKPRILFGMIIAQDAASSRKENAAAREGYSSNFHPAGGDKEVLMGIFRWFCPIPMVGAVLFLASAGASAAGGGSFSVQNQQEQAVLPPAPSPALLKATGDYCELVKKMSLYFVCKERVQAKENIFSRGSKSNRSTPDALRVAKVKRQDLLFDYQIIKKGYDFQEKRVLLERDGKSLRQENAELNTLKISARNLVFGPVGFLSRYWQAHFRYELLGEESIEGKTVVVIRAVPSEERAENNTPGKIWIDPQTSQIMRIEFEPQFQDSGVPLEAEKWQYLGSPTHGFSFTRHFLWTVDYGREKNGILFPTRQSIVEEYRSNEGYRITKRSVAFEYSDYRFFTVDVEVKNRP